MRCNSQLIHCKWRMEENKPSKSPNHKKGNFHLDRCYSKHYCSDTCECCCNFDCRSVLRQDMYNFRSMYSSQEHRKCSNLPDSLCIFLLFDLDRLVLDRWVDTVELTISRRRVRGRSGSRHQTPCEHSTWWDRKDRQWHSWSNTDKIQKYKMCRQDIQCRSRTEPGKLHKFLLSRCRNIQLDMKSYTTECWGQQNMGRYTTSHMRLLVDRCSRWLDLLDSLWHRILIPMRNMCHSGSCRHRHHSLLE